MLSPYWCGTWTFSRVTSPARHHAVEDGQEVLDLVLSADDFDDERQVLGEPQNLCRMKTARMAEAHWAAQNRRARQASFARLQHDRVIERAALPGLVVLADEDFEKHGVARKGHGSGPLELAQCRRPEAAAGTILADRGFGDVKLFEFLESLGFGYVIRFRGNVHVTAAEGETRLAVDWVGKAGRARLLRGAELTAARHKVGAAVCVHAKGMKEAWHLAASDATASASQIVNLYAKRWTIEPGCRDTKDLRFGMGLSVLRIGDPQRRDRLLLLNALAILLLTLLGAAGESLGMDRSLRTSTVKRRVHSLFRQGCLLYDLIPNMPEQRLRPLVEKYEEFLNQNNALTQTFGHA